MVDLGTLALIALVTLGGVVLDTYFWIRTTLALRRWEPVVASLAARFATLPKAPGGLPDASVVEGAPEQSSNGRWFVRLRGGATRFISAAQAAALKSGAPLGAVDAAPPAPEPQAPGDGAAPDLDYAGMAQVLGRTEGEVRSFVAAYTRGAGGDVPADVGDSPGGGAGVPPPGGADETPALMGLLKGLVEGRLDHDAAKGIAREVLADQQRGKLTAGGTMNGEGQMAGAGGVYW